MISIIIPVRNRPDELARCLKGLLAQRRNGPHEVLVIDDASSDDDSERVCAAVPVVTYTRLDRHRGSAYCRNLGLLQAHGAIVLFLDSDVTFLSETTLEAMAEVIRTDPECGQIGGEAIVDCDGTLKYVFGRHLEPSTGTSRWCFVSVENAKPRERFECDYLPTSNCMMRRDVALRLNGFDDAYPGVGEDKDFGYRVMTSGFRSYAMPETVVNHHFSSTGRGRTGLRKYYRTQIRFCLRYHGLASTVGTACRMAWRGRRAPDRSRHRTDDPDIRQFEMSHQANVLGLVPSPHLGGRLANIWHAGWTLLLALLWNLVSRRGLRGGGSAYLNLRDQAVHRTEGEDVSSCGPSSSPW